MRRISPNPIDSSYLPFRRVQIQSPAKLPIPCCWMLLDQSLCHARPQGRSTYSRGQQMDHLQIEYCKVCPHLTTKHFHTIPNCNHQSFHFAHPAQTSLQTTPSVPNLLIDSSQLQSSHHLSESMTRCTVLVQFLCKKFQWRASLSAPPCSKACPIHENS